MAEETVNRSRFGGGAGREAADLGDVMEQVRSGKHADASVRSAGSGGQGELMKTRPALAMVADFNIMSTQQKGLCLCLRLSQEAGR